MNDNIRATRSLLRLVVWLAKKHDKDMWSMPVGDRDDYYTDIAILEDKIEEADKLLAQEKK